MIATREGCTGSDADPRGPPRVWDSQSIRSQPGLTRHSSPVCLLRHEDVCIPTGIQEQRTDLEKKNGARHRARAGNQEGVVCAKFVERRLGWGEGTA